MESFKEATDYFAREMKRVGRMSVILEIENIIAHSREEYVLTKIKEYLKDFYGKEKD